MIREIRMKAIAVVIAIPLLVSTSWAQSGPDRDFELPGTD